MSALAQATQLAASSTSEQPVSNQMLLTEFVVVFLITAVYTIFKARASSDRSPVKLGIVLGVVVGLVAVGLTMVVTSSTSLVG